MVGGDESEGTAPGQWGRDRGWLQRFGAGGKGFTARGHLDPGPLGAQGGRCLPSLCHPNSLAEAQGCGVGWAARGRQVQGEEREPGSKRKERVVLCFPPRGGR